MKKIKYRILGDDEVMLRGDQFKIRVCRDWLGVDGLAGCTVQEHRNRVSYAKDRFTVRRKVKPW